MKAKIEDGVLVIVPETVVETNELNMWKIGNTREIGTAKAYCSKAIKIDVLVTETESEKSFT